MQAAWGHTGSRADVLLMRNSSSSPKVGDRIRIAISHAGLWRPLAWLRVAKDGSIYFGVLLGRPLTARLVTKSPLGSEGQIKYNEGQLLERGRLPKGSRASFHPSGEIHLRNEMMYGSPFRDLKRRRQLCLFHLTHPKHYRPAERRKANDYDLTILDYQVDDSRPMYGTLFVEPYMSGSAPQFARLSSMTYCKTVYISFTDLSGTMPLTVQVAIGHGIKGSWPPAPGVLVLTQDAVERR